MIRCMSVAWKAFLLSTASLVYARTPLHMSILNDIATNNVFVTYYSPKCEYSQHFLNIWRGMNVQQLPTLGGDLVSHLVNCQEETDLCVDQKVKYYPSIRFHHKGWRSPLVFRGERSPRQLLSFLGKALLGSADDSLHDGGDAADGAAAGDAPPDSPGGVMQLTDGNFDALTAGEPVFVKFYTDWCPHCRQLAPLFPQLAAGAKQLGVALASVDCEAQAATCSKQAVPHYPLLALFAHGRLAARYDGDDMGVSQWLDFLRLQVDQLAAARAAAVPAGADGILASWFRIVQPVALTWETFEATAKDSEFLFVKFYAPWCSHCQRLAPVWDRLAHELSLEFPGRRQFTIGRVDCTQEAGLCSQHQIRGYPTLLLFRRGSLVDSFRGLRDLAALAEFARASVRLRGRDDGATAKEEL